MPIVTITVNAAPKQPLQSDQEYGMATRPNLMQSAEMEVQYQTTNGSTITRYYPLGVKNGAYLIIDRAAAK